MTPTTSNLKYSKETPYIPKNTLSIFVDTAKSTVLPRTRAKRSQVATLSFRVLYVHMYYSKNVIVINDGQLSRKIIRLLVTISSLRHVTRDLSYNFGRLVLY